MLFHLTITHSQADCPGRRPAETPELIGPADRLEALGDELSVTSHSLVWGASCILWAEPEHVAYALLEAPSLEAIERYVNALTPAGWATRALPVFTMPAQLEVVRQLLTEPVMPHRRPPVVVAEPAAVVAEPAAEADAADTLEGLTIAQPPYAPPDTTPAPDEVRLDQQVTQAIPQPVIEPPVAPVVAAAEPVDKQVTRAIPQPAFEPPVAPVVAAAEPVDMQVTRPIPQPVFEPPVAPVVAAAEPPDKQITRAIPQPVFEPPVAPSDRGSSPASSAVTRFIERPALLESLPGSTPRADEPEPPSTSVTPSSPLPSSERITIILETTAQRAPGLQLVAKTGPAQGSVFDVGEAGATLGRLPDNSICLTDGRLSRHHARIDFRAGEYWLSDLASQNGTMVNDRPLTEAHRLQAGDSIELGTTRLTVMLDSDD